MPGYRAKKRLGQNFLKTASVIQNIIEIVDPRSDEAIVEIGSGRGALTLPLAESGATLIAVEFDRDLIGYLKKLMRRCDNVRIVNRDFLELAPADLAEWRFSLVGNLPYNITSPVIEWACRYRESLTRCVFMVQKEVAARLCSRPGSKDWSPLAILTGLDFELDTRLEVSPRHFSPPPQVGSAVIELTPRAAVALSQREPLERLVRAAFRQRRKLLANNLRAEFNVETSAFRSLLAEAGLPENARAEQIEVEQFQHLTELLLRDRIL